MQLHSKTISLRQLMKDWFATHHNKVFQQDFQYIGNPADDNPLTVFFYQGFRVAWASNTEFAIGNSNHYSTMSGNFEKLDPANPDFFNEINHRLERIGA